MNNIAGLTVWGPTDLEQRGGVVAFQIKGIHPHDIAQVLDQDNICIRVGFHCAQPLHEYLNIGPTARASFYVYTTEDDIDIFINGLIKIKKIFS
jgi:cysteine desulfurase / selenocysteine lyase